MTLCLYPWRYAKSYLKSYNTYNDTDVCWRPIPPPTVVWPVTQTWPTRGVGGGWSRHWATATSPLGGFKKERTFGRGGGHTLSSPEVLRSPSDLRGMEGAIGQRPSTLNPMANATPPPQWRVVTSEVFRDLGSTGANIGV